MICLATPRLLLRTWRGDDLDSLVQRFSLTSSSNETVDIGNLVIEPDPSAPADDDVTMLRTWFEHVDRAWDRQGYGLFVLEQLDDAAIVGLAGLEANGDARRPNLVWRVAGSASVEALSIEAVGAVIDWAFGLHDLDEVAAVIEASDLDATDVARSAGLRLSPHGMQLVDGVPSRRLSLTQEQWTSSV